MKHKSPRILGWEAHLIERAAQGEVVAFELLADLYRPALLSLATRMLRNSDDAKDAVQESMLKAFRAIGAFDPERPIKPWLCRICANCCVDIVRTRRRNGESLDQHEYMLADGSEDLEQRATGTLRQKAVLEAVGKLPEKYRQIIMMRHMEHMDVTEIAEKLSKPEGTIKSRIRAGLLKLRTTLATAELPEASLEGPLRVAGT